MRITFRLILSILIVVSLIVLAFTLAQVRLEMHRQQVELERRASLLADGLAETVEPLLGPDSGRLQRIVVKFSNRERLAGIAVYDDKGTPMAVTPGLAPQVVPPPREVSEAIGANRAVGAFVDLGQRTMYLFALPLRPEAKVLGALVLFYDASYIQERVRSIWQDNFIRLLVQALLVSLTTLLILRWSLFGPITKMTDWMKRLRKGEADEASPFDDVLLKPLAAEVTQLAKSLSVARSAAEEEARLRRAADWRWTRESLKEHLRAKFQGGSIVVISNREPYSHQ